MAAPASAGTPSGASPAAIGYEAEKIDREIAADNARADALGLVFDSDPRRVNRTGAAQGEAEPQPADQESNAA